MGLEGIFDPMVRAYFAGQCGSGDSGYSDYDGLPCFAITDEMEKVELNGVAMFRASSCAFDATDKQIVLVGENPDTGALAAVLLFKSETVEDNIDGVPVRFWAFYDFDGTDMCYVFPEDAASVLGVPSGVFLDADSFSGIGSGAGAGYIMFV